MFARLTQAPVHMSDTNVSMLNQKHDFTLTYLQYSTETISQSRKELLAHVC